MIIYKAVSLLVTKYEKGLNETNKYKFSDWLCLVEEGLYLYWLIK